jgi:hypothetical protein
MLSPPESVSEPFQPSLQVCLDDPHHTVEWSSTSIGARTGRNPGWLRRITCSGDVTRAAIWHRLANDKGEHTYPDA